MYGYLLQNKAECQRNYWYICLDVIDNFLYLLQFFNIDTKQCSSHVISDPYVKMYLLYNSQRIAKKKTHVKKRTLNPVFNESFVFDIPVGTDGLDNVSLEFLLLDWDRVTKNEVLSCIVMCSQP